MTGLGPGRVAVVDGARTPFCKAWTELAGVPAQVLGRVAVQEAIARSAVVPADVDEVIVGNIAGPADAANVARVIGLQAGLPETVPAWTVNRNCGSALQAISDAALRISHGAAECIVAGGVESMSRIPLLWSDEAADIFMRAGRARSLMARLGALAKLRPRHFRPHAALESGLTDPVSGLNMGQTAEVLAQEWGIARADQDAFALRSHQRAAAAWRDGILEGEIAPVPVPPGWDRLAVRDNGIREEQSLEALGRLKPVFDRRYGTVTAGNSSQITDGAAAVVLASEEFVRERRLDPLGWIRSFAVAGCDPKRMGLGPVWAVPKALAEAGARLPDMALVEINEAFAAQVLACARAMESESFCRDALGLTRPIGTLEPEKTNVNGGAIALGHPVGASGGRLVLTLLRELRRRGEGLGLACLCIGGGQGAALVCEAA